MFFAIRKSIIVGIYTLISSFVVWCATHREVFQPFVDVYDIWSDTRDVDRGYVAEIDGEVISLLSSRSLRIRDNQEVVSTLVLAGIDQTKGTNSRELRDKIANELVGRRVSASLTYTNQTRVVSGLVFVDEMNFNLDVIGTGLAPLDRRSIRSLPILEQYRMLSAERASGLADAR